MPVRPVLSPSVPVARHGRTNIAAGARRLLPALVVLSLLIAASMPIGWATGGSGDAKAAQAAAPPSGDVIVVFKDRRTDPREVARNEGAHPRHVYSHAINGFAANLTERQVNILLRRPDIAVISPNIQIQAADQTLPTGVDRVDADQNPIANSGQPVDADIAILDSGIDPNQPDLNVAGGVACTNAGTYDDDFDHGTHVAGIAGALDNNSGVVGVAPGARLWAVRVLNGQSGTLDDVLCGLDWVVAHADTIDVVNMSLDGGGTDGPCTSTAFHLAICNTVNAGVPIVVAAGNPYEPGAPPQDTATVIPATYDQVITVSAFNDFNGAPGGGGVPPPGCGYSGDDQFASYSNFGADVDIAAPGTCILSTFPGGGFGSLSGTSMATPHVTGAVALFKSVNPGASPDQVRSWLLSIAQPQSGPHGFTGDPDGTHEPVLWLGANVGSVPDPTPDPGAAFAEQSGMVVMEAEHAYARLSRDDHGWYERTDPLAYFGFIGDSFMRVEPDTGDYWTSNYATNSPELQYNVNFQTTGTYYVWVRAQADDGGSDSLHAGLDGAPVSTADKIYPPAGSGWHWTRSTMDGSAATVNVTSPGLHTVNIWAREDGLRLDRILLTKSSSFTPTSSGPVESPRADEAPAATGSLSTTRTTVNIRVTATVAGYPASRTVQIVWDGDVLATFQTDVAGAGSGDFRVPATPLGFYPVALVSGSTAITTQFEVVPRIKITPGTAAPGDTVDISLRGYRKKEVVRIRWKQGSSWVELTRVTTSNTGSKNVDIRVPSWAPDGSTSVRGDSTDYPDGGRAQTNAFTVDSSVAASEPTPTTPAMTPTPTIDTAPPFAEQGGSVAIEAEHAHLNAPRGDHAWTDQTGLDDFAGDGFMAVEPDSGWYLTSGYANASPELQYQVQFAGSGTYYVWVRALAASDSSNSLHVGLDGAESAGGQGINLRQTDGTWQWIRETMTSPVATLQVPSPGLHTINVWMREDGLRLDRIIVTANPDFVPEGTGPAENPRTDVAAASAAATPTPTPTVTQAGSPSAATEPTATAEPTVIATATTTQEPTLTPEPTTPPEPTATATPTSTPEPTATATPTVEPTPTNAPAEETAETPPAEP